MANQNEGNFARSQVTSKVKTSKLREAQENGSDHLVVHLLSCEGGVSFLAQFHGAVKEVSLNNELPSTLDSSK